MNNPPAAQCRGTFRRLIPKGPESNSAGAMGNNANSSRITSALHYFFRLPLPNANPAFALFEEGSQRREIIFVRFQ